MSNEERTFANEIRAIRAYTGLSQEDFGNRIGKSRNTIANWEKGDHLPDRPEDILDIERAFNLSRADTDKLLYLAHFQLEYDTPDIAFYIRKTPAVFRNMAFSLGPYEVPYIILEGNGESVYTPENIVIHYDESNRFELPSELEAIKRKVAAEEQAKKDAGKEANWNGPITFLDRWSRVRTLKGERLGLELWFGHTDFFTFTATNMRLHEEKVFDPKTGRMKTLYEKYFANYDWSLPALKPQALFSNIFGVVVALVTSDNLLIIGKRPPDIGARANVLNIAINESVHPEKDIKNKSFIDIYRTAKRGTKEELGFHLTDLKFFAFGVDSERSMWNLLGVAYTGQTADEVIKGRLVKALDRFEVHSIYTVPFDPTSVCQFVDTMIPPDKRHSVADIWSPGALTCIYYALVNRYKFDKVDREIKAYFNRRPV